MALGALECPASMIFPLRTDVPLRSRPYMNWLLVAVNCAVFAAQSSTAGSALDPLELDPLLPHYWQFVTYSFLHADIMHLVGNMLFLYIFGNNVCDRLGGLGYLGLYLGGAVAAGLGHVAIDTGSNVIGASGAVAAITGAYLVLLPLARITVIYWWFLIGALEVPSYLFVAFFFAKDVLGQTVFGGMSNIAHMTHIAGTLFGFCITLALLAFRVLPRDYVDLFSILKHRQRRQTYRAMVRRGYNPYGMSGATPPPPKPTAPVELDDATMRLAEMRAEVSEALAHGKPAEAAELYRRLQKAHPTPTPMSRQAQMDIANHLASEGDFEWAASAYELALKHYPNQTDSAQVALMLGMIYAHRLSRPADARRWLELVAERFAASREGAMARHELQQLATPGRA